ncbi:hypothetical protein ACEN2J_18045 [Pseudorhodobacter sp. W20_MBD10_FR17]|uniref:hypothetical protein n=1 Tax=Pseudorhodobacter sp. W20_MBD10_FR17 TaxID=3240266 RepID=UPI003F9BDF3F
MNAVVAEHFEDNPASGHVLRRLGVAEVGREQSHSGAHLVPVLVTFYRLQRAYFLAFP